MTDVLLQLQGSDPQITDSRSSDLYKLNVVENKLKSVSADVGYHDVVFI